MTIDMDDSQITTLEQLRSILKYPEGLKFKGLSRNEKYGWLEKTLNRFDYFSLGKKDKGVVKAYLSRMTGFSRAQLTRLISIKLRKGSIKSGIGKRHRFEAKYTIIDKELLAQTDNAHGRLSGPATKRIFQRLHDVYGDKKFNKLKDISPAHIYNLRLSRTYKLRAQTFARTQSIQINIGARRKPEAMGKPGWIRVDTVHQGDLDGQKGVYHINMVDSVLQ